jgi:hypothetical protein
LTAAAAPVASGRGERVAEPVALGMRELGTVRGLVGWMMVEFATGAPVLRTGSDEAFVTMAELLALTEEALLEAAALETGFALEEALLDGTGVLTG